MGSRMHGRDGEDLVIPVPLGTVIKDKETGAVIADLVEDSQEFVSARGGRGGQGNQHFATATRQVPRFAQPGEEGEEKQLVLELKLLADVGLVGLPNAGKSTLISVISSARPKIADYPFTTLVPNLGVVKFGDYTSFVVADIPGLIEGAHKGAGLGFQFLRHIERTRIFLHLVDISDMSAADPIEQYQKVSQELNLYSDELISKKHAVVASKIDASTESTKLDMLREYCKTNRIDFFAVSAATREGTRKLLKYLGDALMREREKD